MISAAWGLGEAVVSGQVTPDTIVVDQASGYRLEWEGYPMVLPVSDKLRERVTGEAYEERVAKTLERLKLVVTEPVG